MAKGDLVTAYEHYLNVLKESPSNKEALTALGRIRSQLTQTARQDAAARLQSSEVQTAPLLRSSLQILKNASRFDPDGSLLGNDIRQYESRLVQMDTDNGHRADQVRELIQARRFPEARKILNTIAQTDPDFEDLFRLNGEFRTGYGDLLEKQIMQAYKDGRLNEARLALAKWKSLGFDPAEQSRLQTEIKTQEISSLQIKTRRLVRRKQYYTAYRELNQSPFKGEIHDMMAEVRRDGARFYLNQALQRTAAGNISRAYLESVKGFELNPEYPGMFEMHRDSRDKILKQVQRYIAIPAFDSPKDNPDVGTQFSDALISYLFRILPYGINIVERGKIDILMEEHKREFSQVANILNVDLIVTGNVSLLKIDRQDNQRQSTVRVPMGEKLAVNPEYEAFLQSGRTQKAPPKTVKVKEYGNFTINKGNSVVKGFAGVAVRIFDTSKGRITYAQEFNANYQEEDEYQDALEMAGIEGDPLTLSTDTEISEKLRKNIVKQLATVIQKQFEKREKDFLETARYHLSRREKDLAVKELARGFLYCVKAKIAPKDPDFTHIRENIIKLTETDYL
ncbi:hypothetical protein [Desulfospira joergensenii]|uniref:hypothetical protein n=1 Tax=Desulfospira joergensenii TaxID=53329 RepID=UPI0003B67C24|nr:hypothetical protein [Desulfospira joergensenii]